jgi:hypothetical protein
MPIASGTIGRSSNIAAPRKNDYGPKGARGAPLGRSGTGRIGGIAKAFRSQPFSPLSAYVTGITKDSAGAALGGCTVHLFRTADDMEVDQRVSDGSGNYSLICAGSGTFYVVAYKAGGPDVAGTTVNTLIGS